MPFLAALPCSDCLLGSQRGKPQVAQPLHACAQIAGAFFGLPPLLRALGQPAELTQRVAAYLLCLLPAVWVDAVYRPLNRTLVAMSITQPQMWCVGAGPGSAVLLRGRPGAPRLPMSHCLCPRPL